MYKITIRSDSAELIFSYKILKSKFSSCDIFDEAKFNHIQNI